MPIIMMTSINTLYEVSAQDTLPINQVGAPHIEALFNGLTQIALQNPDNIPQNIALAEQSFIQQRRYLDDAAHVAVNAFNPTRTIEQRFRATVKLKAIQGELQAFDHDSSSSGLAYALALAMTWAEKKCLLTTAPTSVNLSTTPVFATGSVPIDCYVKPVGFVTKKIHHVCDYIESHDNNEANSTAIAFIIVLPRGNLDEVEGNHQLTARINKLNGKIIAVSHFSEALTHLLGHAFDGGIFTTSYHGFAGLKSISYEQRRLFMGREELVNELIEKSYTALEQQYILNVSGVSGSGKSSAVMAGLLPQLLQSNPFSKHPISYTIDPHWIHIRPSQFNTVNELWHELFQILCSESMNEESILKNDASSIATITQNIQDNLSKQADNETHRYVWVIDQYEELFTHNSISFVEAQRFFSLLAYIAEHLPILIITIIRTEYLSTLGGHASTDVQLPRRIQPSEIERIIQLQLSYHRLSTEAKNTKSEQPEHHQHLEQRIKNDAIGKPLTTVSYLLEQMHLQMINEDASAMTLTHNHYDTVGRIEGVMAKQADLAMQQGLKDIPQEQHTLLQDSFFEAFIGIDNDGQAVARALRNSDITHYPEAINAIIQAFMSKGLVIDCGKNQTPKIKLAHDTLLPTLAAHTALEKNTYQQWAPLNEWFIKNHTYLLWRQEVDTIYKQWLDHDGGKAYLLTERRLLKKAKSLNILLDSQNRKFKEFIAASLKQQTIKRMIPWIVIFSFFTLFITAIWHQYFRITSDYFAFIGERYGIPYGIQPLNRQEKINRGKYFELTQQGGRIITMALRNSDGELINDSERENIALWRFSYTEKGDVLAIDSFAKNNKPIKRTTYEFTNIKNTAFIRFNRQGSDRIRGDIAYQASRLENFSRSKSDITRQRLQFDDTGLLLTRYFLNNNEQATRDATGAYGIRYYYNRQGLVSRLEYIGKDNDSIAINGIYSRHYQRDNKGNIISKEWLDNNGQLILNSNGYAKSTAHYNEFNQLTVKKFYNANNILTANKQGFSQAKASYNNKGQQTIPRHSGKTHSACTWIF